MAVEASAIQQLAVRAILDETAPVEDENEVGSLDAREPMGADENRPAREMGAEPVQDQLLGLGVHTGQCVVEDQDTGGPRNGPRAGHPLPLSPRPRDSPLSHHSLEAIGE